jgi:hypothetical protein
MKIAFLQDFFDNELIGGAEQNDAVLLEHMSVLGHHVVPVHTYMIAPVIECYDFFIVSNFTRLPQDVKQYLIQKKNYIIYEHDHKYVKTRNPAAYEDFKAPPSHIINRDFYANAKKVFVLSKICKEVIEKNLNIDNVVNIGCSLWSKKKLDILRRTNSVEKTHEYGILKSNNEIKGTKEALNYCKNLKLDLNDVLAIASTDYEVFIKTLASCEKFIFLPQVLETYSRVCAEAKMVNCKIITTPKMLGFFSEDYSELSGIPLVDKIECQITSALGMFEKVIC